MIQFNSDRFGKLVRLSLVNDRKYYIKSFLQVFVIFLMMFLLFTKAIPLLAGSVGYPNYKGCAAITLVMIVVTIICGPSYMFYSMEGKHDKQALLMLPASNFEKYLMRYATWLILAPLFVVGFFAADLLQYAINTLLGHEYVTFVISTLKDFATHMWQTIVTPKGRVEFVNVVGFFFLLLHSFYALGATFFRSRKFNWVLTTIILILGIGLIAWLFNDGKADSESNMSLEAIIAFDVMAGLWAIFNFWLSYRLFCRTQVIDKFVNL